MQAQRKNERPRLYDPKITITIRLDADIVKYYRELGSGWQTRINEVLRRSLPKKPTR
jgi:uncharacterized protein (DUF4415 family)